MRRPRSSRISLAGSLTLRDGTSTPVCRICSIFCRRSLASCRIWSLRSGIEMTHCARLRFSATHFTHFGTEYDLLRKRSSCYGLCCTIGRISRDMGSKEIRGRSAWLVTRHWVAENPTWEVAAIFSSRLGGVRVREMVELLSLTSYSLEELAEMHWPQRVPYPARFGQAKSGEPWEGEIFCGNDPFLRARLVDDLKVERDADGCERAVWKERPVAHGRKKNPSK